jgi:hypothetical protein
LYRVSRPRPPVLRAHFAGIGNVKRPYMANCDSRGPVTNVEFIH